MPGDRVRVLPLIPRKGLHWLCISLGFMHGLCGAWIVAAMNDWLDSFGSGGPWGPFKALGVVALSFLVPAILVAMLITRVHAHFWRLLLCAAIYAPCCCAGIFAVIVASNPQMLLLDSSSPWDIMGRWMAVAMGCAIACTLITLAFAGAFGVGFLLERFTGRRIIRQSGTICWSCGYDLGVKGVGICPECGGDFDPAQQARAQSPRFLGGLIRARRFILAAGVILCALPILYEVVTYAIPATQFLRARPAGATLRSCGMLGNWVMRSTGPSRTRFISPLSDGWWLPDPDSSTLGTVVQFVPDATSRETRMFVSRAHLYDFAIPAGAVIVGGSEPNLVASPGSPRVHANLTREQAAHVITAHAVPQALLDKLRERAESVDWKPSDPMVPTPTTDQPVDPAPFFK